VSIAPVSVPPPGGGGARISDTPVGVAPGGREVGRLRGVGTAGVKVFWSQDEIILFWFIIVSILKQLFWSHEINEERDA